MQVTEYLEEYVDFFTKEKAAELLAKLDAFGLNRREKLMLLNLCPVRCLIRARLDPRRRRRRPPCFACMAEESGFPLARGLRVRASVDLRRAACRAIEIHLVVEEIDARLDDDKIEEIVELFVAAGAKDFREVRCRREPREGGREGLGGGVSAARGATTSV